MAYIKQTWLDQEGQVRYTETVDGSYKIFTPNYEEVTEIGTPVDALHMNHIEDGIAQCYTDFENMLKAIYPVGAMYIGTMQTCPIPFGTWQLIGEGLTLQQADATYPTGTVIPAGLPNLKGSFTSDLSVSDGSLFKNEGARHDYADGSGGVGYNLSFDASRKSSIYRDDIDTVQPPALAVNIWQRTA